MLCLWNRKVLTQVLKSVAGMSENGHGGQLSVPSSNSASDVLAKPLHIQRLEQALNLDPMIKHVKKIISEPSR